MEVEFRNLCITKGEPGKSSNSHKKRSKNILKTIKLFENFILLKMEKDMFKFSRNVNWKHR